ncbi:unnamed protein product [Macrosiphum euphorbiae]|uniref:C2H2-type domain-containing protein n=1 Tax=Macrosiphum euphorbiae TaxID=13131 RepID=A0AAV0WU62_9HEMI|nr:unnamed protein product [Macrosiphum euphorbiae]
MFKCVTCFKVYVLMDDLINHFKTHDTSPFSCDICFKMFTLRTNLSKHIRNAHISDSHTHQCRDATQMGAQLQPTGKSIFSFTIF